METSGFCIHISFFLASIITLSALAQRSTNEYVFATVVNDISGWTNSAVAFGIGSLSVFLGPVGKIYCTEYVRANVVDIANY
jgi:choline transport protein